VPSGHRLTAMRTIVLITGLLLLAGCAPPLGSATLPGVAQFDMATVIASDKTMLDHLVSATSGKNCSSVRIEKGLHYCEEDESQGVKQNLYCYSSIGRVTCYDRPDPYRNNHQRLGENEHNLIKPRPVNAP